MTRKDLEDIDGADDGDGGDCDGGDDGDENDGGGKLLSAQDKYPDPRCSPAAPGPVPADSSLCICLWHHPAAVWGKNRARFSAFDFMILEILFMFTKFLHHPISNNGFILLIL